MKECHGSPGEHISKSAAKCLEWSQQTGDTVRLVFNDVELVVDYHSHSVDDVVSMYDRASAKRHEEWKASLRS